MGEIDLNLLTALDALLAEGSVAGAARRLRLSASAMSRTLARLRAATGDPLLVRAGRGLVPTPHAIALRDRVHDLARDAQSVLSPQSAELDLARLERSFTIRSSENFLERFSVALVSAVMEAAPHVRLRFAPKPAKTAEPLREGEIDLEIGVLGAFAPEVRAVALFRDRFVGAARAGHPLLERTLSPERYAACRHVVASRRGIVEGPVDHALRELGLRMDVAVVVPEFSDALRIARRSDLVALVPQSCLSLLDGAGPLGHGLVGFALPVTTPDITVSAMWHPRMEADAGHRWLRDIVMSVCRGPSSTDEGSDRA